MATPILSYELWEVIAPPLPLEPPRPKGGRRRYPDRAVLTRSLFVLRTGIPWETLPQEWGCGSGMTCWRRLRDWQRAGVWHRLHQTLLDRLGERGQIDWSRARGDSATVRAKGGERSGRPESDGSRQTGSKRHVVVDAQGIPLAIQLTAANVNKVTRFEPLLDAIEPIKRPLGRPRKRLAKVHVDKAYAAAHCRTYLRRVPAPGLRAPLLELPTG